MSKMTKMSKLTDEDSDFEYEKQYLIPSNKVKLNSDGLYRHRLLYFAVIFNKIRHVELFLRYHTSPFYLAYNNRNAIHAACEYGRKDILELFMESEYAYSDKKNFKKPSLLNDNQAEWIRYTQALTGDVDTPLHLAVRSGDEDVIKYLIDQAANTLQYNLRGWTPFQLSRS